MCREREVASVCWSARALLLCRWHKCRAVVMGSARVPRAVLYWSGQERRLAGWREALQGGVAVLVFA